MSDGSRAYRAGLMTGRIFRVAGIGLGLSGAALGLIEGFAPPAWRTPGAVAAIVVGVLCVLPLVATLRSLPIACFGVYFALVGVGTILQSHKPRPTAALVAIAAGTIVTSVTGTLFAFLAGRQTKELDRLLFTESISVAFFVTMLFALAYSLLEAWVKVPKLSMWVVFTVGMWTWLVATFMFRRRYS